MKISAMNADVSTFNNVVNLNGTRVGEGYKPYIVAELSGNHNQCLERALELVNAVAKAGAQAVKLQTYTADTMTLDISVGEFFIEDKGSIWRGKSLYQLYKEAHTPWEWHKTIMERCKELGLAFFSTPFDSTALEFLESLDVPFYKIASPENVDIPLIKKVAKTGKPLIISTGMANLSELYEIIDTARSSGCKDLILMKCTSAYPALPTEINLKTIRHMMELFNLPVGLSDHTLGIGVPVAAVALGASVIEKHFTLDRTDGGVDSEFSLEPYELNLLCSEALRAWQAIGEVNYEVTTQEAKNRKYRRSIYVIDDVRMGEFFSKKNIRVIRPALGLAPKHYEKVLGRRASKDSKRGEPLSWDHLD